MPNVFAIPIFFICFRETLETSVIVSVLLAFLKQTLGPDRDPKTYKKLVRQVWWGTAIGVLCCLVIGAGFIGAFYGIGKDRWSTTESIWEGVFAIAASIVISWMGAVLLRISKLQDKWRIKLAQALENGDKRRGCWNVRLWSEKYAMFFLPFITVLREGLEAVIFIGGVGLGLPPSSFPLAVLVGILCGCLIGFIIYKGGNFAKIQIFLIVSTGFLYLVAAGLFSKGVWALEMHKWNEVVGGDAAETGSGPGSYDIRKSVWHVNCCNPKLNGGGGWGIFNALLGWTNSATVGSVVSYNLYWVVVIAGFLALSYREKQGHWPLMASRAPASEKRSSDASSETQGDSLTLDDEKISKGNMAAKTRSIA